MNYCNAAGKPLKVTDAVVKKLFRQSFNSVNFKSYRITALEQVQGVEVIRHCCGRRGIVVQPPVITDVNGTLIKYLYCPDCSTIIYNFDEVIM